MQGLISTRWQHGAGYLMPLVGLLIVTLACSGVTQPTRQPPEIEIPTARPTQPDRPTEVPEERATAEPGVTPTVCPPDVTYVQDVTVPDGTEFAPGTAFTKAWRVRSSGCRPWPDGARWAFLEGTRMGAPESVAVPRTAVGSQTDISVPMQAPNEPGTYRGVWQMQAPDGARFGDRLFVEIVVTPEPAKEPSVTFVADRYTVKAGQCTTLSWNVTDAEAVVYNDQPVGFAGSRLECPSGTTVYRLAVQRLDGRWVTYDLGITVEPAY